MRIRAYEDSDLDSILKIANKVNKNTHEFIPLTRKSLRAWIHDSDTLMIVAEDQRLKGFTIAEKEWPAEPDEIEISMLCAEAGGSTASVERRLLDECWKVSAAKGIVTTLPIGDPKITLQEGWGFRLNGGLLQLTRSLRKMPPKPRLIEGARIRGLEKGEEEELVKLLNTSYARPRLTKNDLKTWIRDDPSFNYEWIQVVEYQRRLIAVGVSRRDLEYNKHYHMKRGYLGPSGTLPEFRGKGLNRAVNWHAMDFVKKQGLDSISLYTHEDNFAVLKLTQELGYTIIYHWKLLKRRRLGPKSRVRVET